MISCSNQTKLLFLGLLFVIPSSVWAVDEDMEEWEKDAELPNVVILGVGNVSVDGDKAQFLQREGIGENLYGGLEYLHYTTPLADDLTLEIEARAIASKEDYLARFKLIKDDVGFLEFGYETFRTWYDASGGYDPQTDTSYHYFDELTYIDRDRLWMTAQYENENGTVVNLNMSHQTRKGMKGSSSWAEMNLPDSSRKNIVPSFYDIDETRDTIEGNIDHHGANIDVNVGGVYQSTDQNNSRKYRRNPDTSADRYVMQSEDFGSEMYNGHGALSYRINKQIRVNAGTSYTSMDTILNGSRTINGEFSPVFDPTFQRQNRDHGFLNLDGKTKMKQWVLNANAEILPTETFQIVPSIRVENYDTDSHADVLETNSNGTTDSFEELQPFGDNYWDDVSAQVDLVYRGIRNWVFTGKLYSAWGEGDLSEWEIDPELSETVLERKTTRKRDEYKAEVGVKYYARPGLHYIFNYYHKEGKNDYDHVIDPTASTGGDRLPAFFRDLDFTTDDANVRISWRPTKALSLVTRFDYQLSKTKMSGGDLALIESSQMKTTIFSEAFTFIPNDKLVLQGSFNWVSDKLDTPVNELDGVDPTLVPDANNDYWQAELSANILFKKGRSLLVRFFHYESDGYTDNSDVTQPYGFSDEQSSLIITGSQRISDNTTLSLQYGYYDLKEETFGGRNDYTANVIYCRMEHRF